MENPIILIIAGESCSGKDSVVNVLVDKYNFHKMVSYTTRPPRKGEIEGKDYFFLKSNEQFDELLSSGVLFEKTEYNTTLGLWSYGIGAGSINFDKPNVVILNPHGIEQVKQLELFKDATIVYITADLMTRVLRYLDRDNIEPHHKVELVDRILRDYSDFFAFDNIADVTLTSDFLSSDRLAMESIRAIFTKAGIDMDEVIAEVNNGE